MFPCTREQWVDGILSTLMRQAAGLAALGLLLSGFVVALSYPGLFRSWNVLRYLPFIVTIQYLGCGIGMWSAAFRERITHYFFALLLVVLDLVFLNLLFSRPTIPVSTWLIGSGALLLVAIAMHREARRWWLATEPG